MDNTQKALEFLEEAIKGEGAFDRDPIEHASNTIKSMKELIGEAIKVLKS